MVVFYSREIVVWGRFRKDIGCFLQVGSGDRLETAVPVCLVLRRGFCASHVACGLLYGNFNMLSLLSRRHKSSPEQQSATLSTFFQWTIF